MNANKRRSKKSGNNGGPEASVHSHEEEGLGVGGEQEHEGEHELVGDELVAQIEAQ